MGYKPFLHVARELIYKRLGAGGSDFTIISAYNKSV